MNDHEEEEQLDAPQMQLLKKCPTAVVCHQLIPPTASAEPDTMMNTSAASVNTPNTYIHDDI